MTGDTPIRHPLCHHGPKRGKGSGRRWVGGHARYRPDDNPTEDLVPFILESFGRPSTRAVNFLRQFAPTEPGARSRELRRAYRELSCLAQLRLAELLRSSLLFVRTYQTKRSDSCGKSGYLGEIQISTKSRGIFRYTSKR